MMEPDIKRYLVNLEASITQRPRYIFYRIPEAKASSRIRLSYVPSRNERRLLAGLRKKGFSPRIWPRPEIARSGDSFWGELLWFVYDTFLKMCFGSLLE